MNDRLKAIRQSLKMTQKEFGATLGVNRDAYASYESGRVIPNDTFIQLLCVNFKVNENWIRYGFGDMFKETEESFINELATKYPDECDDLLKRIVSMYIKLNSDERKAIQKYIDALSTPPPKPEEDTREVYRAASSIDDKPDEITRMAKCDLDELDKLPGVESDDDI